MTKCLVDKDTVEKIHALKKRKQGVRNAERNDLYDPFQTYKGFYTLSSFSGETMTYIYWKRLTAFAKPFSLCQRGIIHGNPKEIEGRKYSQVSWGEW